MANGNDRERYEEGREQYRNGRNRADEQRRFDRGGDYEQYDPYYQGRYSRRDYERGRYVTSDYDRGAHGRGNAGYVGDEYGYGARSADEWPGRWQDQNYGRGNWQARGNQEQEFGRSMGEWPGDRWQGNRWQSPGDERGGYGREPYGRARDGYRSEYGNADYAGDEYGYGHGSDSSYGGRGMGEWQPGRWQQSDYGRGMNQWQGNRGSANQPWSRNQGRFFGVGPQGYQRSDERIREDINEQMTWHGDLDPRNIQVKVEKGIVTLSGTVDERWAKRTAEDIADSVRGVQDVQNQLQVQRQEGMNEQAGQSSSSRRGSQGGPQSASSSQSAQTGNSASTRRNNAQPAPS